MNLQENIRKVLREESTTKMVSLINKYMKEYYPKFNEEDTKYEEYEDYDGYLKITYYNPDGDQYLATYRDKRNELELNRDLYNELHMVFGGVIKYVIDWFNFEFGENAKYLVRPEEEDEEY